VSEYQHYEFQAVDKPLSGTAMEDLRALSSRAKITPTRFQNVYHYGDFRGDPLSLMKEYFDMRYANRPALLDGLDAARLDSWSGFHGRCARKTRSKGSAGARPLPPGRRSLARSC
jgi:hypothetical protein